MEQLTTGNRSMEQLTPTGQCNRSLQPVNGTGHFQVKSNSSLQQINRTDHSNNSTVCNVTSTGRSNSSLQHTLHINGTCPSKRSMQQVTSTGLSKCSLQQANGTCHSKLQQVTQTDHTKLNPTNHCTRYSLCKKCS